MTAEKDIAFTFLLITCITSHKVQNLLNHSPDECIAPGTDFRSAKSFYRRPFGLLQSFESVASPQSGKIKVFWSHQASLEFRNEVVQVVIFIQKLYHGCENAETRGAGRVMANLQNVWFGGMQAGSGKCCRKCDVGKTDKRERAQLNSFWWRHHWSVWLRSWGIFSARELAVMTVHWHSCDLFHKITWCL